MKIINTKIIACVKNIQKSFSQGGVYKDNATNRKLGRVGQPYKKDVSEKKNEKEDKEKYKVVVDKTSTLKNAKGKKLDAIISYYNSGAENPIKVDDKVTDEEKRNLITKAYWKFVDGDTIDEKAEALDSIIEDALDDYTPNKN